MVEAAGFDEPPGVLEPELAEEATLFAALEVTEPLPLDALLLTATLLLPDPLLLDEDLVVAAVEAEAVWPRLNVCVGCAGLEDEEAGRTS